MDVSTPGGEGVQPSENGENLLTDTVEMMEKSVLPHDRLSHLINGNGPTEWFIQSARRWVAAMMADEGSHEPIIERNKRTKAEIRAKEAGTLAGL